MILITSEAFDAKQTEIETWLKIANLQTSIPLKAVHGSTAFRNYLVLTHCPELVVTSHIEIKKRLFYSRYFWLLSAVRTWQKTNGCDAGMEQQVFQLLESADFPVDWEMAQAIEKMVDVQVAISLS